MDEYTIMFARSARRELESLDASIARRVFPYIERTIKKGRPRPYRNLTGIENPYVIRVGDYRIVYVIYAEQRVVDIVAVRHRSEAYR